MRESISPLPVRLRLVQSMPRLYSQSTVSCRGIALVQAVLFRQACIQGHSLARVFIVILEQLSDPKMIRRTAMPVWINNVDGADYLNSFWESQVLVHTRQRALI